MNGLEDSVSRIATRTRNHEKRKKKSKRSKYHPSSWHWWLLIGALRLVCLLPYGAQLAAGRAIGRVLYVCAGRRRHIAEVNLRLCFPGRHESERVSLVRQHFEALGIGLIEVGLCWWASDAKLGSMHVIDGLEHIERAQADGRGVLLLCCHATCNELTTRILAGHVPIHVVYKPFKNPVLEAVSAKHRGKHGTLVSRKQILGAVRHLRHGGVLWYAFDQSENKGEAGGVVVPFFAEPKVVHTGPARIARMSGAVVLPLHTRRLHGSGGYRLSVGAPLEGFPSGDTMTDALRVMGLVEDQVRMAPEQYSWAHPRFVRRGDALADPYSFRVARGR